MTNTASTGAYRGAGRPEAIYLMERLIDEAARQTGIGRLSLRRRNFIRPEQMPYTNAMGQQYDSGRFERVMDQALPLADRIVHEAGMLTDNLPVRGYHVPALGWQEFAEEVLEVSFPNEADAS